jgi:hypothetical protein
VTAQARVTAIYKVLFFLSLFKERKKQQWLPDLYVFEMYNVSSICVNKSRQVSAF